MITVAVCVRVPLDCACLCGTHCTPGIDASAIKIVQGDTDFTPEGMTGGSRFSATGQRLEGPATTDLQER